MSARMLFTVNVCPKIHLMLSVKRVWLRSCQRFSRRVFTPFFSTRGQGFAMLSATMQEVSDRAQRQNRKFEGISLIYLVFFVLAVLTPSLVVRDYFGIAQIHVEEILIFVMGLFGLLTFTVYERLMEKRVAERDHATQSAERVTKELVESYKYIGSMNRQIEILKKLANETSVSLVTQDAYWKDLLQSLASNAASCTGASRALIRCVELEKLRTECEIFHGPDTEQIRIANKELRQMRVTGALHAFVRTEDGETVLIVPSGARASVKAHVIVACSSSEVSDVEISLLRVLSNQAELVYHTLVRPRGAVASSPTMNV